MIQLSIEPWPLWKKILFRFFFVFFTLFLFPFPFSSVRSVYQYFQWYSDMWVPVVNWVGKVFFNLEKELALVSNGSGDQLYDYLQNFTFLLLTIIVVAIWSFIDKKRYNYSLLQKWFVLFLTYYMASVLLSYGISKVFYLQFPEPGIARLLQTYGQSSPMRIMWTFMGASEIYTKFSGWAEVIAGVLLLFSRTRTLGGLATFGVMFNVFVLNLSYDIPVKLFSFLIMSMGMYVFLLDYKRVFSLFFSNRAINIHYDNSLPIKNNVGRIIVIALQLIFIAYTLYNNIDSRIESSRVYGELREEPGLYGLYKVTNYTRNNDSIPPLVTDSLYWKHLYIDYGYSGMKFLNDKEKYHRHDVDTVNQKLALINYNDSTQRHEFNYQFDGETLRLDGIYENDSVIVEMKYFDVDSFMIFKRGFNWINETPYNRYDYKGFNP